MIMLYLFLFLFYMWSVFYFFNCSSFVGVLLGMEFMGVCTILVMVYLFNIYVYILYFLIFSVCEGVIGLCFLTFVLSFYGSDYLDFFNLF